MEGKLAREKNSQKGEWNSLLWRGIYLSAGAPLCNDWKGTENSGGWRGGFHPSMPKWQCEIGHNLSPLWGAFLRCATISPQKPVSLWIFWKEARGRGGSAGALWLVVFWSKIERTLMRFKLFSIKSQCSPNPNVRPMITQCFPKNLSYHQYSPNYLPINNQHDVWPWLALKDEDGKNLQLTWIFDAPPSCLSSRKIQ